MGTVARLVGTTFPGHRRPGETHLYDAADRHVETTKGDRLRLGYGGSLRVATGGTTLRHFMARPLAEFRRRHPDVTFDYVSATPTPQCLDALRADDADLAFVTLTDDGVLEHRPAVRTPWVLVVPADRHLAAVSPVEPVAAYHRHAARHRLAGDGRTAKIPAPVMTVASRRGRAAGPKHLAQALSARPTAVSMSPSGAPVGSIRPALASSACTAAVASARTASALERARRSRSRTVVAGNRVQQRRPDR